MVCSRTAPYRQLYGQGCASLHLAILNDSPKGILPHLPPQKNPRETVAPHHICSNNLLEKQHCVGGDMLFQALGVEKGKKKKTTNQAWKICPEEATRGSEEITAKGYAL